MRNFKQNIAHVIDIKPVFTDFIEAEKRATQTWCGKRQPITRRVEAPTGLQ
jgi:hypothetical protein